MDPSDTNHVFFTSVQMCQSKDGGRTFAPDSAGGVHVDHHAFWIDPNDPAHWILGNDGGAYVSYDRGRAWWHMPIPIGQFYTIMVDSSQTPYQICGGLQDNGVWCGPSRTRETQGISDAEWYPVNGGDGMWVQIPADDPFTVYSNSQFGSISRLDLRTWQREDIQPEALDAGAESGYGYTWDWTAPIVASAHLPGVVYLGANRLFKLKDRGRDYEILGPDMTRNARQAPAAGAGADQLPRALLHRREPPHRRGAVDRLRRRAGVGLAGHRQDVDEHHGELPPRRAADLLRRDDRRLVPRRGDRVRRPRLPPPRRLRRRTSTRPPTSAAPGRRSARACRGTTAASRCSRTTGTRACCSSARPTACGRRWTAAAAG